MDLLALAIAPGIAICLFIFHRDAYNREPKLNLLITFILGALSVFPAAWIEMFLIKGALADSTRGQLVVRAFLSVALVEEIVKFAVVRLFAFPRKSFDEPLDGIVYCVMASMGFATLENIFYVFAQGSNAYQVGFLRMFTAVPAHATFGVLMGYYIGKAKFEPANSIRWMLQGLFWAVFFHGLYDLFLFLQVLPGTNPNTTGVLLFLGAMTSVVVGLRLSLKYIKTHRMLSQEIYKPWQTLSMRKAGLIDIPLIRDLTFKIWPQTYGSILSKEQIDYMLEMMYSEKSLAEQMRTNEFVIVYNKKEPVGFASIGIVEPGVYKLHKIYVLPSEQGKGTGQFILGQLITALKHAGVDTLQLNVNRQNPAKGFYERQGFYVIREEDIDIGGGYFMNDYVMERRF